MRVLSLLLLLICGEASAQSYLVPLPVRVASSLSELQATPSTVGPLVYGTWTGTPTLFASNSSACSAPDNITQVTSPDGKCWVQVSMGPGTGPISANPTATAGPAAINGTAATFMRSDAAPAVQIGSNSLKGLLSCDGVTAACPSGTISLTGSIPPPSSVVDTQTAAMTVDADPLGVKSQSGANGQAIYNQSVMSGNSTTFNGYDAIRGVTIAPASSTVNTITGVAGYTLNNTVPVGQRSQTVALFGDSVCAVNGSDCWGVDTIVSDNPTQNNTAATAGTGKALYNEFDLNITSPNTVGSNLNLGGTALPTNVTLGVNALGITKLWGAGGAGTGTALYANGIVISDACCGTGINIGTTALSGTDVAGMPLTFNYRDGAGTLQSATLTALDGAIYLGGTVGAGFATPGIATGSHNAYSAGPQAASGTNVPSQYSLWNYFDAAGAGQNYNMQVNSGRIFVFGSTVGNTVASFDFEGGLSVKGNVGVTCSGTPTSSFATVNGIVTHC